MYTISLPRLDPEMKEGTIVEWLKKEGDSIQKGEPIAKVEGDKVVFDVEAPESGVLDKLLVKEGTTVAVADNIALLRGPDEKPSMATQKPAEAKPGKLEEHLNVSPAARRIAKEHSIDLTMIKGSGPDGCIVRKDVLAAIEKTPQTGEGAPLEIEKVIPLTGIRKTIADRMTSSYRTIPHVAITMEVNVSETIKLRQIIEKMKSIKIPFTAFLTKIVAQALTHHPIINSTLEENNLTIYRNVHMGIAIALEEGLIVPVIHSANKKNIIELSSQVTDLIKKAKERTLSIEDLKGGTFTITNLGSFGVDIFTPIINPPQTAILGVGRIIEKPRFEEGIVKPVPVMTLTLVFDHRAVDGAKASKFLKEIIELLKDPYELFINLQ